MDMRALSLALAAVLLSEPVLADPFPTGMPETVGLSSERLQHLSTTLQNEVDRHRIPGAVIAIARKGRLAYYEALGFRDPEAKIPMPRDAIFSIASMTKPMVSVAIMMLHDEGKLFLSDPVGKYLPVLANMQVATIKTDSAGGKRMETAPAKRQPNIQDLLRHTSGFTYGSSGTTEAHKSWPVSSSFSSLTYTGPEFIELLDQPREGQAGRPGVAERFVVPLKPGNSGGGKGPQFKTDAIRGEGPRRLGNLSTPINVQKLQMALHAKA